MHEVIFEADTPAGRLFDLLLFVAIAASVAMVLLESVEPVRTEHGTALRIAEWSFTGVFTLEYACRLYAVQRPWKYAVSFYGAVDLLAIVPTYVSVAVPGAQSLLVIRALRLLRVFRVLKLVHFVDEAHQLRVALRGSLRKVTIFLGVVLTVVVIVGALMYLIEGAENGFTSIPRSIYWAIVTMTTVGYGDIAPQTVAGQTVAAIVMVLGYAIIAVPTGIVSVELARAGRDVSTTACPSCASDGHDIDARHCKYCGAPL